MLKAITNEWSYWRESPSSGSSLGVSPKKITFLVDRGELEEPESRSAREAVQSEGEARPGSTAPVLVEDVGAAPAPVPVRVIK